MTTTQSPLGGPGLTWEEFLDLPDDELGRHAAALIDGEVIWMTAPADMHEVVLVNLVRELSGWCRSEPGRGALRSQPPVQITGNRGYEGDLAWWPEAAVDRQARGAKAKVFRGRPSLVVEVWSPSSWPSEITRKLMDYARVGVTEMWTVDTEAERVVVLRQPDGAGWEEVRDLGDADALTSSLLEGFTMPVPELFCL